MRGAGSPWRRSRTAASAERRILAALRNDPGLNSRELRKTGNELGVGRAQDVDDIVRQLIDQGVVRMEEKGNAHLHYLTERTVSDRVPACPDTGSESVSRVLYRDTLTLSPQPDDEEEDGTRDTPAARGVANH